MPNCSFFFYLFHFSFPEARDAASQTKRLCLQPRDAFPLRQAVPRYAAVWLDPPRGCRRIAFTFVQWGVLRQEELRGVTTRAG